MSQDRLCPSDTGPVDVLRYLGRPLLLRNLLMNMLVKKIALALTTLAAPLLCIAQTATIRGFVYEKATGEPSIFTSVTLKGEPAVTSTDVEGYFSLTKLAPGTHTIEVVAIGFDTLEKVVTVKAEQILTVKLYITKNAIEMKGVKVTGAKREAQTQVRIGITTLTPKQIERMPAIGGQADLAQYMQVVPGVLITGDQGGQLYIRGGSPIMNKVLLDGMVLYNPFHSIGLFSVFDNDIIRNADVLTGGFNAEYGGRMSSVMDVTTRDGNKTRLSGKVSASTFAAKALLEGPLKKQTDPNSGSSSFLINFKKCYLTETSKSIYSYADTAGLPFDFMDLYGKLSFNGANGSKVNLFGFNFTDAVNYFGISDLSWKNWGAGTNFVLVPAGSAVLIDGQFSVSNYNIELLEGDLPPRSSTIAGFNGGLNFKYFVGENEAKYGIELLGFRTSFSFFNSIGREIKQEENTTEFVGYFNYRVNTKKLVIDPGVHLHYYASLSALSIEPRFGIKYNVTDDFRIKGSTGMYSQNLVATNSDRDVVNLFYGFLSSPEDVPEDITLENGSKRTFKDVLQRANHYLLGVEYDLTPELTANLEGYYKDFRQVTNLNRNKIYDDTPQFADKPASQREDFIVEVGDAYGVDMLLKFEKGRTYIWAVYGYSKVERWDGTINYAPIWDRRHNANIVVSYAFGLHDSWKANGRFSYGSGFPFTQTQGFYGRQDFNGGIGSDITHSNAQLETVYGDLNKGRLPQYARVDLGLTKIWKLDEHQVIQADFSVTNVLDRQNIFYFDRTSYTRKDQLPILPSLGVSYTF